LDLIQNHPGIAQKWHQKSKKKIKVLSLDLGEIGNETATGNTLSGRYLQPEIWCEFHCKSQLKKHQKRSNKESKCSGFLGTNQGAALVVKHQRFRHGPGWVLVPKRVEIARLDRLIVVLDRVRNQVPNHPEKRPDTGSKRVKTTGVFVVGGYPAAPQWKWGIWVKTPATRPFDSRGNDVQNG
jgi:hypothetical protein